MTYVRDAPPQITTSRGPGSPFVWVDPVPLRDGLPQFHGDPLIHAILARRLADARDAVDFLNADGLDFSGRDLSQHPVFKVLDASAVWCDE